MRREYLGDIVLYIFSINTCHERDILSNIRTYITMSIFTENYRSREHKIYFCKETGSKTRVIS
jgi:hypothetical protein